MAFSFISLFVLFGMALLFFLCIVLMARSRRTGPGYPACGECGYNLTATLKTDVGRCPECGSSLGDVGVLPARDRGRNPATAFIGLALVVLVLLTITCCGVSIFRVSTARTTATPPFVTPTPAPMQPPPVRAAPDTTKSTQDDAPADD